jgi:hypothetical protein
MKQKEEEKRYGKCLQGSRWKMLTKEVDREYVTVSNDNNNNNNNNIDHNRSIRMDNETICIVGRKL